MGWLWSSAAGLASLPVQTHRPVRRSRQIRLNVRRSDRPRRREPQLEEDVVGSGPYRIQRALIHRAFVEKILDLHGDRRRSSRWRRIRHSRKLRYARPALGIIVAALILVLAFGGLIWVGASTPESFLARLDNPNPDIRWRAAHELSQVLKRPESLELASNPDFALDLAERLKKALTALEQAESTTQKELARVIGSAGR